MAGGRTEPEIDAAVVLGVDLGKVDEARSLEALIVQIDGASWIVRHISKNEA